MFEGEGRPAEAFGVAESVADTKGLIRRVNRPGRYAIYEHPRMGSPASTFPSSRAI